MYTLYLSRSPCRNIASSSRYVHQPAVHVLRAGQVAQVGALEGHLWQAETKSYATHGLYIHSACAPDGLSWPGGPDRRARARERQSGQTTSGDGWDNGLMFFPHKFFIIHPYGPHRQHIHPHECPGHLLIMPHLPYEEAIGVVCCQMRYGRSEEGVSRLLWGTGAEHGGPNSRHAVEGMSRWHGGQLLSNISHPIWD